MKNISVLILGSGGHAKVLLDCLRHANHISVLGMLDNNPERVGQSIMQVPILGHEDDILQSHSPGDVQLVNGIGFLGQDRNRENIFLKFKQAGYQFLSVIHPTAYIGSDVLLGEGVQVMAGSTIQPGCCFGNNIIVNTHTSIDHDSYIEDHVHLAPGVTSCGNVQIHLGTHVGCGATLRQGVSIGARSLIAAGAVVVHDIQTGSKVAGVPAKNME
ncbi:MAG: hypothetical protein ACD_60C00028G0005 [uncultured bacterium]|nr:MAG: hypothetical protein ACD_60C00028G0005 [uncultured bacterium]